MPKLLRKRGFDEPSSGAVEWVIDKLKPKKAKQERIKKRKIQKEQEKKSKHARMIQLSAESVISRDENEADMAMDGNGGNDNASESSTQPEEMIVDGVAPNPPPVDLPFWRRLVNI